MHRCNHRIFIRIEWNFLVSKMCCVCFHFGNSIYSYRLFHRSLLTDPISKHNKPSARCVHDAPPNDRTSAKRFSSAENAKRIIKLYRWLVIALRVHRHSQHADAGEHGGISGFEALLSLNLICLYFNLVPSFGVLMTDGYPLSPAVMIFNGSTGHGR